MHCNRYIWKEYIKVYRRLEKFLRTTNKKFSFKTLNFISAKSEYRWTSVFSLGTIFAGFVVQNTGLFTVLSLSKLLIGWSVVVLGFIPYSFTKKTEKGKVIERKIKALFFEYEKKKEGENEVVIFNFRLINTIRHTLLKLSEEMVVQLGEENKEK